jgi:hypothetical protein
MIALWRSSKSRLCSSPGWLNSATASAWIAADSLCM